MGNITQEAPLDSRLLHNAIIEMNISRRNVSVYHKDHLLVVNSIDRAYCFIQKLLELRPEITIAVAKDTLIVDNFYLDRKNPVYREFALHLNGLNIAFVTFARGMIKDELYRFHEFLSLRSADLSHAEVKQLYDERNLTHIRIEFINYRAFAMSMNSDDLEKTERYIWERYTEGLLDGRLSVEEASATLYEVPPAVLAQIFNDVPHEALREESYDRVIAAYLRGTSEAVFSGSDLRRILEFIRDLKPEIKRQFLSSAMNTAASGSWQYDKAINDIPSEMIMEVLQTANEQNVAIPQALRNILDKLSFLPAEDMKDTVFGDSYIADDIAFSRDSIDFFRGSNFSAFVGSAYSAEIERLLKLDLSNDTKIIFRELIDECSSDNRENFLNRVTLEIVLSCIMEQDEAGYFSGLLKKQIGTFIEVGSYNLLIRTFTHLFNKAQDGSCSSTVADVLGYVQSEDIMTRLVRSFRNFGRQMRDEVLLICTFYGKDILPYLFDSLIDEESQAMRSFIINIIVQYGERALPEARNRLSDGRWYVKRNMLYIINQCGGFASGHDIYRYAAHENYKVRLEAIKLLVRSSERRGVIALRECLKSSDSRLIREAASLSGTLHMSELVPDLISVIRKKRRGTGDMDEKRAVVRALGMIADNRALDEFMHLIKSEGGISKAPGEQIIRDVFNALANFSYEEVSDIVKTGLMSDNRAVRESADALRRHFGADDGR